jgi:hypothetical protein
MSKACDRLYAMSMDQALRLLIAFALVIAAIALVWWFWPK